MAVVGADDDVVLAGVLQDVGEVLLGLAGDVEAVSAQHVLVELAGAGAVEAGAEVGDDVGDPGGGGFEEAPAEVGEAVGDAAQHQRVKRGDDGYLGHPQGGGAGVEDAAQGVVHESRMDAHRHVEAAGLGVDREVVLVDGHALAHEALQQEAAGAVVTAETELFQRHVHGFQRQRRHPAQPSLALAPDVAHPAVVGAAHGDLGAGAAQGCESQKGRRVENLDIRA